MKIRTVYGIPRSISIGLTISFILVFFVLEAMSSQPHALKHIILDKSLLTGPSKFDYDVNNKNDFRMGFVETIGFEEATVGGLLATRNGSTYGVHWSQLQRSTTHRLLSRSPKRKSLVLRTLERRPIYP
jgi:hypothetical protein